MKKLSILILTILFVLSVAACTDNSAVLSDIQYEYSENSLNYFINITPNKNIDNLTIEYLEYNAEGKVINTRVREIGNVVKDRTYKIALGIVIINGVTDIEVIKVTGTIVSEKY